VQRIKVLLAVSFTTAVVFWGLTAAFLTADLLRGPGRPAVVVTVAVAALASHLTWLVLFLHRLREKSADERLRGIEDEYRHREALLIKTLRQLAGGPGTGPMPRLYVASGERR